MSNEQLEKLEQLGRRAVACKRWRWMEGMKVVFPPVHESDTGFCKRLSYDDYNLVDMEYPDLTDPATVGCLLALVREALKPRGLGFTLCLANTGAGWQLGYLAGGEWFSPRGTIHRSEVEALVAALEAAP